LSFPLRGRISSAALVRRMRPGTSASYFIYETESSARLGAARENLRRGGGDWNSMKVESRREMHFSLDFLREQLYI
jgi:hypothetical protein